MAIINVVIIPCPYCGKSKNLSLLATFFDGIKHFFVYCSSCYSSGPPSATPEGAVNLFNFRVWFDEQDREKMELVVPK